ncbi:MAG: hypothetical protein JRC60_08140 [Deltaproteobacteria bacterium]|nr:hypothetical protein [Deltaproteobacteria bacterium]
MTDRIKGFSVSLSSDMREDDCQGIIGAILMIKGVSAVERHVSDPDDWYARQHVKEELRGKILELWRDL